MDKKALRIHARSHRATLTRSDFADTIARYAADLGAPRGAIVAGYFPMRDEADPRALMSALSAAGHSLALPCVISGQPLIFRRWTMGDPMHANPMAFNIAEPLDTAPVVTPSLVLVPLLAFDASGHRLGYGGGYYDRTLAGLPHARAVGVAYAGQEVTTLPITERDHALDAIITENGVRKFQKT